MESLLSNGPTVAKKVYYYETSAPLWSYVTISLVVGYLNYRLGQVGNGHLLYVFFGSDLGTVVKIGLLGTMAAQKSGGMHFATISISTFRSSTNLNHH